MHVCPMINVVSYSNSNCIRQDIKNILSEKVSGI